MQDQQFGVHNIKKFLLVLLLPIIVNASTNTLTINSNLNKLYYETDNISDNLLYHIDMTPGKTFEDTLNIKNLTTNNYMLYLKINKESVNEEEQDLLNNINIIIHNKDNKLLYDGPASGTDYKVDNTLVDDTIYIGTYKPYDLDILKLSTTLKKEYDNKEDNNIKEVEWQFYAISNDKVQVINPNTNDNIIKYILLLLITPILIILIIKHKKKI